MNAHIDKQKNESWSDFFNRAMPESILFNGQVTVGWEEKFDEPYCGSMNARIGIFAREEEGSLQEVEIWLEAITEHFRVEIDGEMEKTLRSRSAGESRKVMKQVQIRAGVDLPIAALVHEIKQCGYECARASVDGKNISASYERNRLRSTTSGLPVDNKSLGL